MCGYASSRGVLERNRVKEMGTAMRICVTVEIREGYLTRRARITAPSIERALKIAREGKLDRRVSLVFPIDPQASFVPEGSGWRDEHAMHHETASNPQKRGGACFGRAPE